MLWVINFYIPNEYENDATQIQCATSYDTRTFQLHFHTIHLRTVYISRHGNALKTTTLTLRSKSEIEFFSAQQTRKLF